MMKISEISKIIVQASSLYIDTKKETVAFLRKNRNSNRWYKATADYTDKKPYSTADVIAYTAKNKGLIF